MLAAGFVERRRTDVTHLFWVKFAWFDEPRFCAHSQHAAECFERDPHCAGLYEHELQRTGLHERTLQLGRLYEL
jgi:hypothetical protein